MCSQAASPDRDPTDVTGLPGGTARGSPPAAPYGAAVLMLWEEGAISPGVAAAELGLTHHDFLDLLASKGW